MGKSTGISKIKRTLVLKVILSGTTCVYLRTNIQVSNLILTSFRQEGGGGGEGILPFYPPPRPSKQTPKKPTQIRVNQSNIIIKNNEDFAIEQRSLI